MDQSNAKRKRRRTLIIVIIVIVVVLIIAGVLIWFFFLRGGTGGGGGGGGTTCTTNSDCVGVQTCVNGTCTLPSGACNNNNDCPLGQQCVSNTCEAIPPECTMDSDCTPPATCQGGSCVSPEPECLSDAQCSGGTPKCKTDTGTCVQCLTVADCTGSDVCTGNVCTCALPSAPNFVSATRTLAGPPPLFDFVWGAVAGAVSYNLYGSASPGFSISGASVYNTPLSINNNVSGASFSPPLPNVGPTYFKVTAVDTCGESLPSNEIAVA